MDVFSASPTRAIQHAVQVTRRQSKTPKPSVGQRASSTQAKCFAPSSLLRGESRGREEERSTQRIRYLYPVRPKDRDFSGAHLNSSSIRHLLVRFSRDTSYSHRLLDQSFSSFLMALPFSMRALDRRPGVRCNHSRSTFGRARSCRPSTVQSTPVSLCDRSFLARRTSTGFR